MARPSAPLLEWLRKLLKQRNINSAQIAEQADLPRARVRKILSGAEPMLFDEFLAISGVLELKPEDLGLPEGAELPDTEAAPPAPEPEPEPEESAGSRMDPWGNQPRQLVEAGFALGCDFGLVLDTSQLGESGMPRTVIDRYQGGPMRIQLDAAYHRYNEPAYEEDALTLTLSFDALYSCTIPWSSILQIVFQPVPPDQTQPDEPDEPDEGRPRLRLVT